MIFLPKYIKIEMVERGLPATNGYTIYIGGYNYGICNFRRLYFLWSLRRNLPSRSYQRRRRTVRNRCRYMHGMWSLRRRMSSRSYQPGIISRYVYCSSNKKEMHFYASLFCSIYSLTCFDVGRDSIAPSVAIDKAAV